MRGLHGARSGQMTRVARRTDGTDGTDVQSAHMRPTWLLAPGSWLLAPGSWLLAPSS